MRKRAFVALTAAAAAFATVVGNSWADHAAYSGSADSHLSVPGNPDCPDGTSGFKVEGVPENTTYNGLVTVTGSDGTYLNWTLMPEATLDMAAVIVKGGPNATVFVYGAGVSGDVGLSAPWNKKQPYGVSHVSFCFGPDGGGGGGEF